MIQMMNKWWSLSQSINALFIHLSFLERKKADSITGLSFIIFYKQKGRILWVGFITSFKCCLTQQMKNIELLTTNLPKRSAKIFSVFFYLRNKKGAYSAPKSISYSALPAEPKKSVIMSLTKAVIASAPGFNSLRGS